MAVPDSPLDAWLPDPHVRTQHARSSPAPPDRLWGVAGRLWSTRGGLARLSDPEHYRGWEQPGTARVAVLNAVVPRAGGGAQIVTETRVRCVDRRALLPFRPCWAVVGPFTRFIRTDLLAAAVRRA